MKVIKVKRLSDGKVFSPSKHGRDRLFCIYFLEDQSIVAVCREIVAAELECLSLHNANGNDEFELIIEDV